MLAPDVPTVRTCPRCGCDAKLCNILPPRGCAMAYTVLYRCDGCDFVDSVRKER